jgi:hypothetical protein
MIWRGFVCLPTPFTTPFELLIRRPQSFRLGQVSEGAYVFPPIVGTASTIVSVLSAIPESSQTSLQQPDVKPSTVRKPLAFSYGASDPQKPSNASSATDVSDGTALEHSSIFTTVRSTGTRRNAILLKTCTRTTWSFFPNPHRVEMRAMDCMQEVLFSSQWLCARDLLP